MTAPADPAPAAVSTPAAAAPAPAADAPVPPPAAVAAPAAASVAPAPAAVAATTPAASTPPASVTAASTPAAAPVVPSPAAGAPAAATPLPVIITQASPGLSPAPALPAQGAPSGGLLDSPLPLLVGFMVIMYFTMIRPQQKRAKDQAQLISGLQSGDEVLTNSGIYGFVANVSDNKIILKVAEGTKITMDRNSVATIIKRGNADAAPAPAARPVR